MNVFMNLAKIRESLTFLIKSSKQFECISLKNYMEQFLVSPLLLFNFMLIIY